MLSSISWRSALWPWICICWLGQWSIRLVIEWALMLLALSLRCDLSAIDCEGALRWGTKCIALPRSAHYVPSIIRWDAWAPSSDWCVKSWRVKDASWDIRWGALSVTWVRLLLLWLLLLGSCSTRLLVIARKLEYAAIYVRVRGSWGHAWSRLRLYTVRVCSDRSLVSWQNAHWRSSSVERIWVTDVHGLERVSRLVWAKEDALMYSWIARSLTWMPRTASTSWCWWDLGWSLILTSTDMTITIQARVRVAGRSARARLLGSLRIGLLRL
jgi:hypothetical protein